MPNIFVRVSLNLRATVNIGSDIKFVSAPLINILMSNKPIVEYHKFSNYFSNKVEPIDIASGSVINILKVQLYPTCN